MSAALDRWIIKGRFVTCSPLAIRTGAEEIPAETKAADWQARPGEANTPPLAARDTIAPVQAIETDCDGRPFIPATAIKGLLRSLAARRIGVPDLEKAARSLFGDMPRKKEGSSAMQPDGGSVMFPNAWLVDDPTNRPAAIRGRTAIHRGTRTARDGYLRHDRAVAPDTEFEAEFVLDGADEAAVALLLALLALVKGKSSGSALGSGSGQGDGRVEWVLDAGGVRCFGEAEMAAWLALPAGTSWKDAAKPTNVKKVDLGPIDRAPRVVFPLQLHVDGHFLVSVAAPVNNENDRNEKKDDPDRVPFRMRRDEPSIAWLPGSSLDGALSAQAERIWRTMAHDLTVWGPASAPDCHRLLFGAADQAGLFDVSVFRSDPDQTCEAEKLKCKHTDLDRQSDASRTCEVQMEFVAIDRFTGGSLDGAKFSVKAFEAPVLGGEVGLTLRRDVDHALTGKPGGENPEDEAPKPEVSAAAIGLLALTLKDLAEGDIPLGYGTRKGFGRIGRLDYEGGGWRELLLALGAAVAGEDGPEDLRGLDPQDAIREAVAALEREAALFGRPAGPAPVETQEEDAA